ncbi:hypothetical protein CFAM422_008857 [Trichoderma lentiforme]|uniref:Uncharacterized protein n=1 Tax=Trichoderma lentiforme TaxID=1567552 RepID=A0A9P5CC54_9HYPO|nr:hypothetical protein CFAM422_008857 [Trichoderma lentiforme]
MASSDLLRSFALSFLQIPRMLREPRRSAQAKSRWIVVQVRKTNSAWRPAELAEPSPAKPLVPLSPTNQKLDVKRSRNVAVALGRAYRSLAEAAMGSWLWVMHQKIVLVETLLEEEQKDRSIA